MICSASAYKGFFKISERSKFGAIQVWQFYYGDAFLHSVLVPIYLSPFFELRSMEEFKRFVVSIDDGTDSTFAKDEFIIRFPFEGGEGWASVSYGRGSLVDWRPDKGGSIPGLPLYMGGNLRDFYIKRVCPVYDSLYYYIWEDATVIRIKLERLLGDMSGDLSLVTESVVDHILPFRKIQLENYFTVDELHLLVAGLESQVQDEVPKAEGNLYDFRNYLLATFGEQGGCASYRNFNEELLSVFRGAEALKYVELSCSHSYILSSSSKPFLLVTEDIYARKQFYTNLKKLISKA